MWFNFVRFGFPEVDLGILPAATGTQRFPRLAGLAAALDLIPTGRRIGPKEALKMGAIDKVSQYIIMGRRNMEGY